MDIVSFVGQVGFGIELFGVVVIVLGMVFSTLRCGLALVKGGEETPYEKLRNDVGRSLLVGLEFLVAGDIIRTVIIDHSLSTIAALGLLVVVRTILVWTIHLELEQRWPWQKSSRG